MHLSKPIFFLLIMMENDELTKEEIENILYLVIREYF